MVQSHRDTLSSNKQNKLQLYATTHAITTSKVLRAKIKTQKNAV